MLLPDGNERIIKRSTGVFTPKMAEMAMGILASSDVIAQAEGQRGSGCTYSVAQLFVANMIREAGHKQYWAAYSLMTPAICRAMGLPKKNGEYRRPSAGTLNWFVNKFWPSYSKAFSIEYAKSVVMKEIEEVGGIIMTLDGTPLEASRYNYDADFNVHYKIVMDKMHIIMANGAPIFGKQTAGNINDSVMVRALCELLAEVPGLRDKVKFMMDGGYDSFHCYAEVYLATGVKPQCVIRADAVVHEEASWQKLQQMYSKMHAKSDYDPYKKNDEEYVLRFLARHGRSEYVGMYLRNSEIQRQVKEGRLEIVYSETPDGDMSPSGVSEKELDSGKKDTDRQVCETVHRAMKNWIAFDIRHMRHATRQWVVAFKFSCCQVLSSIFARYADGPTV